MKETKVKNAVYNFLKSRYPIVRKEFDLPIGGRIDHITFNWKDEYDLEICGYECKGSPSPSTVARILRRQVSEYQNVVPRVYLALSTKKVENLKYLCHLNGVGLLIVDKEGGVKIVQEAPSPPQPLLKNQYFEPLRATAAMFLSFRESFGENLRSGNNWCSTPEKNIEVQFNSWYSSDSGYANFSVNLENSRYVLRRINLKNLQMEVSSLPEGYWISALLGNYYAPRREVSVSFFSREASEVTLEDITYLKRRSANDLVHLNIAMHLWRYDDLFSRRTHEDILQRAKEHLSSIHNLLSS